MAARIVHTVRTTLSHVGIPGIIHSITKTAILTAAHLLVC